MKLTVEVDDRTRVVSSAMILTDFVHLNDSWSKPHPVRTRTLARLAGFEDHPCVSAVRKLGESHFLHSFHSFALQLPRDCWIEGARSGSDLRIGGDFEDYDEADFGSLLCRFCVDTDMQAIWDEQAEDWETAREDCGKIIRQSGMAEFIDLFFGETSLQGVVIPDPLDPPTFGFAPSVGDTAYAILGSPGITDQSRMPGRYLGSPEIVQPIVFHEFSHSLWSEARNSYPAILDETAHLEGTMEYKGYFPDSYPDWDIKLDEIIIRAATAHFAGWREGKDAASQVVEHERTTYGLDLVAPVFDALSVYLDARKQGEFKGLSDFVPELSRIMVAD